MTTNSENEVAMNIVGMNDSSTTKALEDIATGLGNIVKGLNNVSSATKNTKSSMKSLSGISKIFNFGAITILGKKAVKTLSGFIDKSNQYIETLNLFKVSMGDLTDQATEFVNRFSGGLGVDPADVMRYTSMFYNLADGFGVAKDEAYKMSWNLTQLSYDLSSFYNLPIDQAMQKIKSGISGEIEPMRAIGIALDQATLQETAYKLGIEQRVATMTRAQKTELLYYQIMTRTTKAQTDMARTILQPANALRVLRNQFTMLGRAIGNIFIPILTALIPYVQVVTKWLTALAQTIANALGFEIDTNAWDTGTSEISAGIENIEDSAAGAAKEIKGMLAPFDELNVIEFGDNKGSGAGNIGAGGSLGIDLPEYDALKGLNANEKLKEAEETLKRILPIITSIGAAFLGWKIANGVMNFFEKMDKLEKFLNLPKGSFKLFAWLAADILMVNTIIDGLKNNWEEAGELMASVTSRAKEPLYDLGVAMTAIGMEVDKRLGGIGTLIANNMADATLNVKSGTAKIINYVSEVEKSSIQSSRTLQMNFAKIQDQVKGYSTQLKDIIDEHGRVKDGFESQAKYITQKLSELTGQQIEVKNNQISINGEIKKSYEEISKSIDELMDKKKKEMRLAQAEKNYNKIIETRSDIYAKQIEAESDLIDAKAKGNKKEIEIAQNTVNTLKKQYDDLGYYAEAAQKEIALATQDTTQEITSDYILMGAVTSEELENMYKNSEQQFWNIYNTGTSYTKDLMLSSITTIETLSPAMVQKWLELGKENEKAFSDGINEIPDDAKNIILLAILQTEGFSPKVADAFRSLSEAGKQQFLDSLDQLPEDEKQKIQNTIDAVYGKREEFGQSGRSLSEYFKQQVQSQDINLTDNITYNEYDMKNKLNWIWDKTSQAWYNQDRTLKVRFAADGGGLSSFGFGYGGGFRAEGGFVDQGEMFIAREAGPELVGTIGNRTAVANNDQIIDGIRQGVYDAMVSANSGNRARSTTIYIGNRKVYEGYGNYANSESNKYGTNVIRV